MTEMNVHAVDPDRFLEGFKHPVGDDGHVRLRSYSSPKAAQEMARMFRETQVNQPDLTWDEFVTTHAAAILVYALIADLHNITFDGRAYDVSVAAQRDALAVMLYEPKWTKVVSDWTLQAQIFANYQAKADAALEGNSGRQPGGAAGPGPSPRRARKPGTRSRKK